MARHRGPGGHRFLRARTITTAAATVAATVLALVASSGSAAARQAPAPFPTTPDVSCTAARVRKEAGSLTAAEWATYQRAVTGLHARETSGNRETLDWFEHFVDIHANYGGQAHGGAHFLAWHRLFLLAYENALRTIEPSVTIPYWDWSLDSADPAMAPVWGTSQLGKSAVNGQIGAGDPRGGHNFNEFFVDTDGPHHVTRGFPSNSRGGMDSTFFPNKATMSALWQSTTTTFAEFAEALEFAHGGPHMAIGGLTGPGGDMMWLSRAAGDVAFWSHHAFIDYLWAMRQGTISATEYGGIQNGVAVSKNDMLAPFGVTARVAVDLSCVSPRQNKCTKHSQCGCGVCDKVKGTCKAPPASRRTVLCGASGKCIARRGGPAYACVGGISCKAQADCGCGTCYKKRCVVRSRLTRSRCGTSASCVLSGRRLVCKRSKNITARALVAAAAAPAALPFISARSSDATRTAYLAKLRKDIEAAQAIRDAGVAEAEEEAEVVIAEADAEIEEVEEKEAAILVAIGSDDDDDDADDGTDDDAATAATRQALTVGGRTSSDELTLAALEEERKAATAARKAAMRELRAKTRRLRRSVRVTALAGFADMNGLDRQHFLRGEEVLERAEDAADADAEEAAEVAEEAAAATDWAADAVAGTGDEEGA
eukprot:contig_1392_g214